MRLKQTQNEGVEACLIALCELYAASMLVSQILSDNEKNPVCRVY